MASDEDLAAALARGDESAFEELSMRYRSRLLGFLYRNAGDAEPEDLAQETWMRVLRSAASFDTRKRFSTWLFQIALNLCRDAARRNRVRQPQVDLEQQSAGSGEAASLARIDAERLLTRLPAEQREVLMLRYYADLGEAEIAAVLECPIGTVKSRLHYGLARLSEAASKQRGRTGW